MYFVIVASTAKEIQPTIEGLKTTHFQSGVEPAILVTGIGMVATTYSLVQAINRKTPDFAIQAGIGGSFSRDHAPASVVIISEEIFGDLGAEENEDFKDIFDLGLAESNDIPFTRKTLLNPNKDEWKKIGLPLAKGITINELTTNHDRIELLKKKYGAAIESMEGAAFHYVCIRKRVPFLQLRAVSNIVGERDKSKWKMEEAIINLNEELMKVIGIVSTSGIRVS